MPSFCAICAVWRLFCIKLHRYQPLPFQPFLRAVKRPSGDRAQLPDMRTTTAHRLFTAQKPQNAQNKTPYQRHAETVKRRRNAYKRPKTLYHADFQTDNTPPETGSRTARTRYRYERRAAGCLHGHFKPPAPYQDRRQPPESRQSR